MLQSPAPALIKMDPPLSGPSRKAKSLMVPSCMLNSRSGPVSQGQREIRSNSNPGEKWTFDLHYITLLQLVFHISFVSWSESKHIKHYLWHYSCLRWKAGLWHIYHSTQLPAVVHSGSMQHSRWSPCGVCSSWSAQPAAWLHQNHWTSQENIDRRIQNCASRYEVKYIRIQTLTIY